MAIISTWRQLPLCRWFFPARRRCVRVLTLFCSISILLLLTVAVFLPHSTFPRGSLLDIAVLNSALHRRRSPIFCYGPLLACVQNASIFNDSKEFVDRPLVASPATVLEAFNNLSDPCNVTILRKFIERWTLAAGSDLELWSPPDWVQRPTFIDKIKDDKLREWALDLNSIWRRLGRRVAPSVSENADHHSLIHLPHPFIVPGGRFREIYYWDTYWILEGLLLCGMNDTARGMIENLVYLVDQYGLVPNGGRQYYTRRSQPPLLSQMVELYYNRTGNMTFLLHALPALATEYLFWMENRTFPFYEQQHYSARTDSPRPEAYREDVATAERVPPNRRAGLYESLASGAESGWDFSSRWLAHNGSEAGQLTSIQTPAVLPVDLNVILCANEGTLARLFREVGNEAESRYYWDKMRERSLGFEDLFWSSELGIWRDVIVGGVPDSSLNGSFYASSFAPLVWRCGQGGVEQDEMFLLTLNSLGVLDYPGGVPTSVFRNSTQQWDFPNAWAPHQWMLVVAWYNSPSKELREVAEKVAKTWLTSTYLAWEKYNHTMFEKYNCTEEGLPGGGGEYITQVGFGWTNAVVLRLLSLYPDTVITSSDHTERNLGWVSVIVLTVVAVAVAIPCIVWCRWLYITGRDRYWGRVRNEHLIAAQGGISHSRPHSRPHSPTTYRNPHIVDHNGSQDGIIYNETLLEFDV